MMPDDCCSSIIPSMQCAWIGARRSIGGMYALEEMNDCVSDTQQAGEYLGVRGKSLDEMLPKFCPQPASKLGKQGQTTAQGRKGSDLSGKSKDADHQ